VAAPPFETPAFAAFGPAPQGEADREHDPSPIQQRRELRHVIRGLCAMIDRSVPRLRSPPCTGTVTLRAGFGGVDQPAMAARLRDMTKPARSSARIASRAVTTGSRSFMRERDGGLRECATTRHGGWARRAPRCRDHQANGILRHRQRLAFVLTVRDDLGKCRHAHGESALVFGFKHTTAKLRFSVIAMSLVVGHYSKLPGWSETRSGLHLHPVTTANSPLAFRLGFTAIRTPWPRAGEKLHQPPDRKTAARQAQQRRDMRLLDADLIARSNFAPSP